MKKVVTERKKKVIVGIAIVLIVFCIGVYITHLYRKQNVKYSHYEEPKVLENNGMSYASEEGLSGEVYTIEDGYISKISPLTTLDDLKNNLDETNIIVYKKDGTTELQSSELVGTGMKLVYASQQYKLSVLGDLNGDGKVGITDVTQINLVNVGLRPSLVNEYLKAGDLNGNGSITITDVTRVNLAVVDLIDIVAPNAFVPEVTSTKDTITVSGSAVDTNSGIKEYWFELNNNGWVKNSDATKNEYVFTNLQNETQYTVRMKVVDNAGNTKITKRVDISTLNIENANISIVSSPTDWTNQNVLVAVNYNSNVAKEIKQVSIDNGKTWVEYTAPLTLEKNTTIRARVTNSSGKVLEEVTKEITNIDKLAPNEFEVTIDKTSNTITVNAATTDQTKTEENGCSGIKEYKYILNDGMWNITEITGENSYTFLGLTSGKQYTIQVIAIDNAGNETEGTYIETDTEGPIITVTGNATWWTNQDVVLSLEIIDAESAVASVTINGEEQTLREGKATYTVSRNGEYTIIATDTKGNTSTKTVVVSKIDKTAPVITFSKQSNSIELGTQEVGVTVTEDGSGKYIYKYLWSESEVSPTDEASYADGEFASGDTISKRGLSGDYYLHVYMKDNAGNETITRTTGTFKFRYEISNEEELIQFCNENNSFEGKTIYLVNDINCTEENVYYNYSFKGIFEGGNHTISKINLNQYSNMSLFGDNRGTIKDLNIEGFAPFCGLVYQNYGTISNCSFTSNSLSFMIASNEEGGVIDGCYRDGKIDSNMLGDREFGAGIVRFNNGTITNCYNKATVNISKADAGYGLGYFGIAERNNSTGIIENCYNTSSINIKNLATDSNTSSHGGVSVAGIVYENYGIVRKSYNLGNITASTNSSSGASANGIVDINGAQYVEKGTIQECYNTGTINGESAGGIGGHYGGILENCYNTGSIIATEMAGGITEYYCSASATITNCYNTGTISSATQNGSIVGYLNGTSYENISNCYYISGSAVNGETSSETGCTKKTTAEMKTSSMVTSLGTTYWTRNSSLNNGYPILKWQVQ